MWSFHKRDNCNGSEGSLTGICVDVGIDTNGPKGPNMIGKDSLLFWVVRKNGAYVVYPAGSNGDNRSCEPPATNTKRGQGCTKHAILHRNPDDMP